MLSLLLKNKKQLERAKKLISQDLIHLPALNFLRESKQHEIMYNLQIKLCFCFIFLYKCNSKNYARIIYDGSQLPGGNAGKKCWIIYCKPKAKMAKLKRFKGPSSLPFKLQFPKQHFQSQLADLLNLANLPLTAPHNFDTTKAWLEHFNLWNRVAIYFCTRLLPQKCHVAWICPPDSSDYILEAFTGTDKTLVFAPYSPTLHFKRRSTPKVCVERPHDTHYISKSHMYSVNMASAVSAKLGGLTSAYYLGLLPAKRLKKLVRELDHTFGALWIHLDQDGNVKHLAYTDFHREGYKNFVISAEKDWTAFFDFLWQRHLALSLVKKEVLAQLMDVMQRQFAQSLSSKHSTCLAQLVKFTSKTRIVVYSAEDKALHAFKTPFAFFAREKKKRYFRGVSLKTDTQNTIVSLSCSFMQIDNVAPFFANKEFIEIVPSWLPLQFIHTVSSTDLNARGSVLANMLHRLVQNFAKFIFDKYYIDLHTWPLPSLTSLSFQAVWLKYAVLGGPFLHAPQKTKPYYEKLLRNFSRGGFSWSVGEHVQSGDILHPPSEIAKSICEYDICSSYGYAAAQMMCPGGFCIGYVKDAGELQRADGFKYKGYEFQATFKFIHDVYQVGGKILAVYSNYHPLGILYLGKYPVDLCIITKNLGHFIVQFDHLYTHGCKDGCTGLSKYVNNKTRCQLEEQTRIRDDAIQQWVNHVNLVEKLFAFVTVSECHTPGYSTKQLSQAFANGQPLHFLIEPYLPLCHTTFPLKGLDQLPSNLTYIVICQGHVQSTVNPPPLFVWNETGQDFSHSTLGENVMLSRLHYEYLVREHNFHLDSVEAILFYRTDTILPLVFQKLTRDRYEAAHSPSQVDVIKCLINFACGYFGYNPHKKKGIKSNMLVTGWNPRIPFQNFHYQDVGDFRQQSFFVKTRVSAPKPTPRSSYDKPSNSALPIFCTIIDMGKMRLGQCFNFIGRVTRPGSVKFLYTHIDNLILTCSETHLEKAVASDQMLYYQTHGQSFFGEKGQAPLPGQLKLEFNLASDSWKFATPRTCFYGLVNDQEVGASKTCSFNKVTHLDAYLYALQMLQGASVNLTQERRVHKLANTVTQIVPVEIKGNK